MSTPGVDPPHKRKRTEDDSLEDAPEPVAPIRSADIWYDDGNVIIQAEGTQYKVYRGILVQSSSVFQDMFSFPQPPASDAEVIEGCPVVCLPDSAEEVKYVLQALFQRKYITSEEKMPLPVLAALICFGKKYDIRQLQVEAQSRIFKDFPITLKECDARVGTVNLVGGGLKMEESTYFDLLLIIKRTGLVSVLPQVLYACYERYSASEIKNGFRPEDNPTGRIIGRFPMEDAITLLACGQAIREATVTTTYKWLYNPGSIYASCQTPKHCRATLEKTQIFKSHKGAAVPSPLEPWGLCQLMDIGGGALCKTCAQIAQREHEMGREMFWERLPSFFDLAPWSELSKEREAI